MTDDFERLLKKVAHAPALDPPSPSKTDQTPPQPTPPQHASTPTPEQPRARPSATTTAAHAAAQAATAAAASAAQAAAAVSSKSMHGATLAAQPARAPTRDGWSGRLIANRYHLGRQLGAGGMGTVFEASDEVLRRSVAVKLVIDDRPSADTIARFRREAQAAAALSDPSIVTVHDFGVEDDVPYIVMERVSGAPLQTLIARGALPWQRALPLIASIARALAVAHAAKVIHRDLKPANIFVVDEHKHAVKLLDFGLSRLFTLDRSGHATAASGASDSSNVLVGTPGFIAPEVTLHGDLAEPRADVYSLGVIAFMMLTGRAPFEAKSPLILIEKHASAVAPAPSSVAPNAGIPAEVDALILQLLAKDPRQRLHAHQLDARIAVLLGNAPSPPQSQSQSGSAAPSKPDGNVITYKARLAQDILRELERTLSPAALASVLGGENEAFIARVRAATAVENIEGAPLWALYRTMRATLGDAAYLAWWRSYTLKMIHMPILSGLLQGVVKVLGLTPHTAFKNLPRGRGSLVRSGSTMIYARVDDTSARMTLEDLPQQLIDSGIGGLTMSGVYEGLLVFVGREGSATIELEDPRARRVIHLVRWR